MAKKTQDERIRELEEFKERIELGQKWLLCASGVVGTVIATTYYLLEIFHVTNGKP